MRCPLLFLLLMPGVVAADEWLQLRSPDLYGRRVTVAGKTTPTTRLLAGADPVKDGLWLSVPDGTKAEDVVFVPPLPKPPDVRRVRVPDGLTGQWHVVPLPLSAYGLDDLGAAQSFGVTHSRRGDGYKAGSVRPREETPAVACGPTPAFRPSLPLRVADFEGGPLQALGNRFALFSGRGGEIEARRARGRDGTRLVMDVRLSEPRSFAGLRIDLGPASALRNENDGVDLSGLRAVLVRGRGRAHATVKIGVAGREDGVVLGTLRGDGGEWARTFAVDAVRVDVRRLRSVTFTVEAKGRLEIDEVVLLGDGGAPAPHRETLPAAAPAPRRSAWIWHTSELLASGAARRRLRDAARRWKLDEVYLQLPDPEHDAALAGLVAELHGAGLAVQALDGAPWLALPQARGDLEAIARRVVAYNAAQPTASRFDALHLDVEPYLLPGFGSRRRGDLLAGFRQSLISVKGRLGALPLWVDVPFWLDSVDEGTTVETGPAAGCARPAFLRDVFGIADGIVVMSYRTRADGTDGVAAVALGELALGRDTKKPVRLGIETIRLGPERGWRVDLGRRAAPKPGTAAVAIPGGEGYVLFTPALAAGDAGRLASMSVKAAEYSENAAPAKITFHGRERGDVEGVVAEALELARRAGVPADGVAFHEARTLP